VSRWPVAGLYEYWLLASSPASEGKNSSTHIAQQIHIRWQRYTQDNYSSTHKTTNNNNKHKTTTSILTRQLQQYTQDNQQQQYTQDNYNNTHKTTTTVHTRQQQQYTKTTTTVHKRQLITTIHTRQLITTIHTRHLKIQQVEKLNNTKVRNYCTFMGLLNNR